MTVLRYEENEWGVRRAPLPDGGHSATAGMPFESNADALKVMNARPGLAEAVFIGGWAA